MADLKPFTPENIEEAQKRVSQFLSHEVNSFNEAQDAWVYLKHYLRAQRLYIEYVESFRGRGDLLPLSWEIFASIYIIDAGVRG